MKNPKFFCENCGGEVKINTKVCPHCGSFFANVRCPLCGFTGEGKNFQNGCPKCGYALKANFKQNQKYHKNEQSKDKPKKQNLSQGLPVFVYVFVLALLLFILALTFFRLK